MQANGHHSLEDLMTRGYINAIKAMLTFTQESLGFMSIRHEVCEGELILPVCHIDGAVINLRTDVIGELAGKSHFILSEREASYLATHSLKKLNGSLHLHEPFLKEMDNIISAAVISKLSHYLQVKTYGDVPIMEKWDSWPQFSESVKQETKGFKRYYINIIEIYFELHPNLKPLFVWILDERFLKRAEEKNFLLKTPQHTTV